MVARLTRLLGPANVELAEDAVQEALVRAVQTWPYQGVPDNAAGWIYKVAHNIAIDIVRRDRTFSSKSDAIVAELLRSGTVSANPAAVDQQIRDDELRMILMCCHPEISADARVALSLKIIGGFSVREIARAFLSDEAAIAQRIVRAKRQIRERQLTLDLPSGADLAHRLDSALDVIYLMFNEGYSAHEGAALVRQDLCVEALRLGRIVAESPLAEPRVHALVALMALQAARFPARVDAGGDLVPLEDQDRSRWDQALIALGFRHFDRSMAGDRVSPFHVQAAIAATHARALSDDAVDWHVIARSVRPVAGDPPLADRRAQPRRCRVAVARRRGRPGGARPAAQRSVAAALPPADVSARATAARRRPPRGGARRVRSRAGVRVLRPGAAASGTQAGLVLTVDHGFPNEPRSLGIREYVIKYSLRISVTSNDCITSSFSVESIERQLVGL